APLRSRAKGFFLEIGQFAQNILAAISVDFTSIAASLVLQARSMATQLDGAQFFIWGIDQSAYGPVELPTLVSWIKDERVLAETWVFLAHDVAWRRAADLPELQMFFRRKAAGVTAPAGFQAGSLRRVK